MRCWGISTGSAGMEAQIRALADAMGANLDMKKVTVADSFVWLPNAVFAAGLDRFVYPAMITKNSDEISSPLPDVVISCGRRSAIAALGLKSYFKRNGWDGIRFVHIQDPHVSAKHFDLVLAMEHDTIRGDNVIVHSHALHHITPEKLDEAQQRFFGWFGNYPTPHVSVLLGGSTNKYRLTTGHMRQVIERLQVLLHSFDGSLLITPSRRTGDDNIALLKQAFAFNPRVYIYDGKQENPYMGLLAVADIIVVTNDSVNMMSEAVATGKPVYILELPECTKGKPAEFARKLIAQEVARLFEGKTEQWSYELQNEMQSIAAEVKARLL